MITRNKLRFGFLDSFVNQFIRPCNFLFKEMKQKLFGNLFAISNMGKKGTVMCYA